MDLEYVRLSTIDVQNAPPYRHGYHTLDPLADGAFFATLSKVVAM